MKRYWNVVIGAGIPYFLFILFMMSPASAGLEAVFSSNITSGSSPLFVEFYDNSTENVSTWNWSFGDGSFSDEQNPFHTFDSTGIFTIILTVSDGNRTDAAVIPGYITVTETYPGANVVPAAILDQPPKGTLSLVTVLTSESSQHVGDIHGDTLVFMDDTGGTFRVKSYGFCTGTESYLPRVNQDCMQANPAIFGQAVVWEEISEDYYDNSVILHNLTTNESIEIAHYIGLLGPAPDIFGNIIVWQESTGESWEIYLYDAVTEEKKQLSPDIPGFDERRPVIFGDRVAWQSMDYQNDTSDIQLLTLSTGELRTLTTGSYSSNNVDPAIWGDFVVFTGDDTQNDSKDIYLYDILTGNTLLLTPATYTTDEEFPAIFGDRVAWQGEDTDYGTYDIYLYNITDRIVTKYSSGTPSSDETKPGLGSNRVIWEQFDYVAWTSDIYSFTLGPELPALIANFSVNTTSGYSPLTVAFMDESLGDPGGWTWDFGDGRQSNEQNPLHTYDASGTFTVTLKVNNIAQRAGIKKEDLICAGSPPKVIFESDVNEGSCPLTVHFHDLSVNAPISWTWSFGDGYSSVDKNPVHTYEHSGLYDVTLTAGNIYGQSTLTMQGFIRVVDGVTQSSNFSIPGITIISSDHPEEIFINTTLCPPVNSWNETAFTFSPSLGCGLNEITVISPPGDHFFNASDSLLEGNVGNVIAQSCPIVPEEGQDWRVVYSLIVSEYPENAVIISDVWENATPEDYREFIKIAQSSNLDDSINTYADVDWVAYTVRFREANLSVPCRATLILGINATWVSEYGWGDHGSIEINSNMRETKVLIDDQFRGYAPLTVHGLAPGEHVATLIMSGYEPVEKSFSIEDEDERDSIHVIRIGDDGSGEVLHTWFLYHDPATNMDYFQAESPAGLSTFGVAALSKSGNPLQLLYLTIMKLIGGGSSGGGSSGGGSTSSVSSLPGENPTPVTTFAQGYIGGPGDGNEQLSPMPTVTRTQPAVTSPLQTPTVTSTGSPLPSSPGLSIVVILKNLTVVLVVVLVSMIFYFRWKRREGGD